jgi:hypothetical protein
MKDIPVFSMEQVAQLTLETVKQIKGSSKIWFTEHCKFMESSNPETGLEEVQKCKWLEPEDLKVDCFLN